MMHGAAGPNLSEAITPEPSKLGNIQVGQVQRFGADVGNADTDKPSASNQSKNSHFLDCQGTYRGTHLICICTIWFELARSWFGFIVQA